MEEKDHVFGKIFNVQNKWWCLLKRNCEIRKVALLWTLVKNQQALGRFEKCKLSLSGELVDSVFEFQSDEYLVQGRCTFSIRFVNITATFLFVDLMSKHRFKLDVYLLSLFVYTGTIRNPLQFVFLLWCVWSKIVLRFVNHSTRLQAWLRRVATLQQLILLMTNTSIVLWQV